MTVTDNHIVNVRGMKVAEITELDDVFYCPNPAPQSTRHFRSARAYSADRKWPTAR